MDLLLIATLLVSGVCSLSQFHVVKEQKNWTEAQQYCRENFTDLATIDNDLEMEKVNSLIQEAGVDEHVWIGLRGKWQWSLADRKFYGENEAEFRNWKDNQPNGEGPTGHFKDVNCVIQIGKPNESKNGRWNDHSCSVTRPFICYDGGNSTHPYVLVKEEKTWRDAQRYCREKHTDPASVRNQTENDQINAVSGNTNVWIGLFKAWEWSDGSSSSFGHWAPEEPNNKDAPNRREAECTEIKSDGLWYDAGCHHPINFVCYEDKLFLIRESKTWNEAVKHCQDLNMDLVSVRTERTQRRVQRFAKESSTAHVWLGLRHACGVGWFWVWGETVCYDNWAPGQGQVQGCQGVGAMEAGENGGKWVSNLTETEKLNFICAIEDE